MRMIFVNLPIGDLERSRAFFSALGFTFNPDYSSDSNLCMVVEENIFVMLLVEDRFKEFINGEISRSGTEVLTCLSAGSRQEVDETLATALASGGKEWRPVVDHGFMYGCSFQDPDGHVWELAYMEPQQAG